jgi:hypothetical protein
MIDRKKREVALELIKRAIVGACDRANRCLDDAGIPRNPEDPTPMYLSIEVSFRGKFISAQADIGYESSK